MALTRTLVLIFLAGAPGLFAQVGSTLQPGSPEVLRSFLHMHDSIVNPRIATSVSPGLTTSSSSSPRKTGPITPEDAASIAGWQRILGLSDADFAALNRCSAKFNSEEERLLSEGAAYMRSVSAAGKIADRAKLDAFNDRHAALLKEANETLKTQLSPSGHQSLFRYIDEQFRPTGRAVTIGGR